MLKVSSKKSQLSVTRFEMIEFDYRMSLGPTHTLSDRKALQTYVRNATGKNIIDRNDDGRCPEGDPCASALPPTHCVCTQLAYCRLEMDHW